MRILALIGSPRKGGNTDLLVDRILSGCEDMGHTGEKLYLYDYDLLPCIDCRKCKEEDYLCILEDGMQLIYPKIDESDIVIFGTPLYWYGPSAKMKLLIDRLRPYVENKKLEGKKGVVVTPSAEGPRACEPLVKMFQMSFDYLGMEYKGDLLATAYEKGEIANDPEELKRAYEFGANIPK